MTQEQLTQLIQDGRQLLTKLDLTQAQATIKRVQAASSQSDFWQRADAQDQIQANTNNSNKPLPTSVLF